MNRKAKNITLFVILILVIVSIWYINSGKMPPSTIVPQDITSGRDVSMKVLKYNKAKELSDPKGFINTEAFKIADLIGKKIILVDFWTYSCINCIRTIPHINAWYEKYKDQGLEIVGVHTPEFDFEKDYNNVSQAVQRMGIKYPVVLDSDRGTWNAYNNRFWPREFLIDVDGFIIHDHIGEGGYDETEMAIIEALKELHGGSLDVKEDLSKPINAIDMDPSGVKSPETYFGSDRNEFMGNGKRGVSGSQTLSVPSAVNIKPNILYLDGVWNFSNEYTQNTNKGAKIVFKYNSKNVYFVASSDKGVNIKIILDGKLVNTINIKENRLYEIIKGNSYGEHTLEMDIESPGLNAYTFTFG